VPPILQTCRWLENFTRQHATGIQTYAVIDYGFEDYIRLAADVERTEQHSFPMANQLAKLQSKLQPLTEFVFERTGIKTAVGRSLTAA